MVLEYSPTHRGGDLRIMFLWGEVVSEACTGAQCDASKEIVLQDSRLSVWLKIVSSWLCYVIYTWAMVARPMFPDRDFS